MPSPMYSTARDRSAMPPRREPWPPKFKNCPQGSLLPVSQPAGEIHTAQGLNRACHAVCINKPFHRPGIWLEQGCESAQRVLGFTAEGGRGQLNSGRLSARLHLGRRRARVVDELPSNRILRIKTGKFAVGF